MDTHAVSPPTAAGLAKPRGSARPTKSGYCDLCAGTSKGCDQADPSPPADARSRYFFAGSAFVRGAIAVQVDAEPVSEAVPRGHQASFREMVRTVSKTKIIGQHTSLLPWHMQLGGDEKRQGHKKHTCRFHPSKSHSGRLFKCQSNRPARTHVGGSSGVGGPPAGQRSSNSVQTNPPDGLTPPLFLCQAGRAATVQGKLASLLHSSHASWQRASLLAALGIPQNDAATLHRWVPRLLHSPVYTSPSPA